MCVRSFARMPKHFLVKWHFQLRLKTAKKDLYRSFVYHSMSKHIRKTYPIERISDLLKQSNEQREVPKKKVFDFVFIRDRLEQFIESLPNAIVSSLNK